MSVIADIPLSLRIFNAISSLVPVRRITSGTFRGFVAEGGDVGPAIKLVVVDHHFGIECDDVTAGSGNQRIDLGERPSVLGERFIKLLQNSCGSPHLLYV